MDEYSDEIDANSLRIPIDGDHTYRKDIINRARERWETRNKSKAVMRSAESFVDVVDELEALLADPDVSDDVKRELTRRLDVRYIDIWHKPADYGLRLDS